MLQDRFRVTRRQLLASAALAAVAASAPVAALAQEDAADVLSRIPEGGAFTRATVVEIARALAQFDYTPPPTELPDPIKDLTYEQYRDIRFDRPASIWASEELPFQLQLFHRGFYYKEEIEVAVVEEDNAEHVVYSPSFFDVGKLVPQPMPTDDIGFAGIRLLGQLNQPGKFDELAVFLGASYFRSLGQGQVYGISSRGLALRTGAPEGEEFPLFRAFWVEKPLPESETIVIHALLDSVSTTGAYRFTIRPGAAVVMDVEATLFPRVELAKVGLAPGTSMFYFGPNGRENVDDWRPEVHDSDGLLMINGRGERLWRPLSNPRTLQVSAFVDAAPRGFGLIQRNRDPDAYQDFESHYDRRPSLWVEPVGDWGRGAVALVEIPSDSEINDNIVAFWQPERPIPADSEYSFAYRLFWGGEPTPDGGGPTVVATRRGRATLRAESPIRRFVIDYVLPQPLPSEKSEPQANVSASAGSISDVTMERNPLTDGWRLTFKLDPEGADVIELRAVTTFEGNPPSEIWLYRWTA
jgi:periplasmic glucans biosynthesis protein